jgi:hypothetical protein
MLTMISDGQVFITVIHRLPPTAAASDAADDVEAGAALTSVYDELARGPAWPTGCLMTHIDSVSCARLLPLTRSLLSAATLICRRTTTSGRINIAKCVQPMSRTVAKVTCSAAGRDPEHGRARPKSVMSGCLRHVIRITFDRVRKMVYRKTKCSVVCRMGDIDGRTDGGMTLKFIVESNTFFHNPVIVHQPNAVMMNRQWLVSVLQSKMWLRIKEAFFWQHAFVRISQHALVS